MTSCKISVLIPVFNVSQFVEIALRSIITQTYSNLEIIVIDDCSTDDTYRIAQLIAAEDPRIVLKSNSKNEGIVYTLNKAFSIATGEFIARMDGDDVSLPDRLEKLLLYLNQNPDVALVGSSMIGINENGKFLNRSIHYSDFNFLLRTLKYVTPVSHIWLARRIVYTELNGYREIHGTEDYDFLLRCISNKFKISNIQDYFGYKVRIGRVGNTIASKGLIQRKMFYYAFGLYKERVCGNADSFCIDDVVRVEKVNKISSILYSTSSKYLFKAIESKATKNYIMAILYFALSLLISPDQVKYIFHRAIYRMHVIAHRNLDV